MINVDRGFGPDGCSFAIDLESHLDATVRKGTELDLDFEWDVEEGCWAEACMLANEALGVYHFDPDSLDTIGIVTDHTYNCENGLSNDFQYTIIPSIDNGGWHYGMVIVLIKRHNGGDPRNGNYAPLEAYVLEDIVENGFFDWNVGFYATPLDPKCKDAEAACEEFNEVCNHSYSNWPWGQVEEMVDSVPENFLGDTDSFIASFDGMMVVIEAQGPYYC